MKAAIIRDYGTQVTIEEVSTPQVSEDSVLIEVRGASINPIDNILRAGYLKDMMPLTFPFIMGYDLAGLVVEVGNGVTKFKIGDEVYARPTGDLGGTLAEYAVVKEAELALKPSNVSFEEAASIPLAGLTAWQALTAKGNLKKGQKVLIHAGSGGVGSLAIQMAKHLGAYVATTTSTVNVEMVKKLGADRVIDYKVENFAEVVSEYDLVIDMMGGEILNDSFKVLKKGGTLVSIKGQDTSGLAEQYGVRFEWFFMWPSGDMLTQLAEYIEAGIVKPVIDQSFAFENIQEAYDSLQTGRTKGKISIKVK